MLKHNGSTIEEMSEALFKYKKTSSIRKDIAAANLRMREAWTSSSVCACFSRSYSACVIVRRGEES